VITEVLNDAVARGEIDEEAIGDEVLGCCCELSGVAGFLHPWPCHHRRNGFVRWWTTLLMPEA